MLALFHWILDYYHPAGYVVDAQPSNQCWLLLFKQPVTFSLDSGILEVPADHCILYTSGARRHYYNHTVGYRHDGIFFQGEAVEAFAEQLGIPCNSPFPVKNAREISAMIREITEETVFPQTHTREIVDLRIRLLMYKLADAFCTEGLESQRFGQFFELRKALFREPERDWNAEEVAASIHLSASRFYYLYKRIFQSTWKQDLINSRIGHAKYLLRSNKDTSDQIAAACGYKNAEHFYRQFKKYTGQTPGRYRQEHSIFPIEPEAEETAQ